MRHPHSCLPYHCFIPPPCANFLILSQLRHIPAQITTMYYLLLCYKLPAKITTRYNLLPVLFWSVLVDQSGTCFYTIYTTQAYAFSIPWKSASSFLTLFYSIKSNSYVTICLSIRYTFQYNFLLYSNILFINSLPTKCKLFCKKLSNYFGSLKTLTIIEV